MADDFWDPKRDPNAVIRHAPDADHYHLPDERMAGRMPVGRVGSFAVIPAANNDGSSKGFDHSKAGVVHVDPNAPDGGAVVDLTRLNQSILKQAMATSAYPHQVFYQLGASPNVQPQTAAFEQPRSNPMLPNSYVVPSADIQGVQSSTQEQSMSQPGVPLSLPVGGPQPVQLPQPPQQQYQPSAAQQQPQMPQPQYQQPVQYQPMNYQPPPQFAPIAYPPPPSAIDPATQALLQSLTNSVQSLHARMDSQHRPEAASQQPQTPPLRTLPVGVSQRTPKVATDFEDTSKPIPRRPETAPQQTLQQYQESRAPDDNSLIVGFETLGIDYVNGPVAQRPRCKVLLSSRMGKSVASYHCVTEGDGCLVLTYDTRFEDGVQSSPPELGSEELLTVQVMSTKKTYHVASMGLSFSHGVFDHCILIVPKVDVDGPEPEFVPDDRYQPPRR